MGGELSYSLNAIISAFLFSILLWGGTMEIPASHLSSNKANLVSKLNYLRNVLTDKNQVLQEVIFRNTKKKTIRPRYYGPLIILIPTSCSRNHW